jgi:hypothetical protein
MKTHFVSLTCALSLSACLAACGGADSDLDPGAGDDPGEGTSTLHVEGRVGAEPRFSNAQSAADFDTEFSVRITLNDLGVTTGEVTITSNSGTFPLTYVGDNGRWEGNGGGYDEVYVLDVISGADAATGIRVDGPDFHTFVKPTAGETVDSTLPLEVTWSAREPADSTAIRADAIDWVSIPDEHTYSLAGGALAANSGEATTNDLQLVRVNRVIPAGAIPGSEFSVRIENSIQVVAQPNPAL